MIIIVEIWALLVHVTLWLKLYIDKQQLKPPPLVSLQSALENPPEVWTSTIPWQLGNSTCQWRSCDIISQVEDLQYSCSVDFMFQLHLPWYIHGFWKSIKNPSVLCLIYRNPNNNNGTYFQLVSCMLHSSINSSTMQVKRAKGIITQICPFTSRDISNPCDMVGLFLPLTWWPYSFPVSWGHEPLCSSVEKYTPKNKHQSGFFCLLKK